MRLARAVPVLVVLSSADAVMAQSPECSAVAVEVRDACVVSVDLFNYMTPQLGVALTGGNLVLAQGGTISGLPHFTLGARANIVAGNLPTIQTPATTGTSLRTANNPYPTTDQYIVLPTFDLAIGLFRGFARGQTHLGGIDLLLGGAFVPSIERSGAESMITVRPQSPISAAWGARVGLITETTFIPGISVGAMQRRLPTSVLTAVTGPDTIQLREVSLTATSWRITAGKSFVGIRFAAGLGQDMYEAPSKLEAIVSRPSFGRVSTGVLTLKQKATRSNIFGDVALSLPYVIVVAEGGAVFGGDFSTANVFDVSADASRIYGSIGLRFGF